MTNGEKRRGQMCMATVRVVEFSFPSARDSEVVYRIEGVVRDGDLRCSCPGFQFRGSCKHLEVQVLTCGWDSRTSTEEQTEDQRQTHTCPSCGSLTVDAYVPPPQTVAAPEQPPKEAEPEPAAPAPVEAKRGYATDDSPW